MWWLNFEWHDKTAGHVKVRVAFVQNMEIEIGLAQILVLSQFPNHNTTLTWEWSQFSFVLAIYDKLFCGWFVISAIG